MPTAGGVVWSSPGHDASPWRRARPAPSACGWTRCPATGGKVVLSRIPWPGYTVDEATLGRPLADVLLTVDIPAEAQGQVVTLHWSPPGWHLELLTLWLAIGAAPGLVRGRGCSVDAARQTRRAGLALAAAVPAVPAAAAGDQLSPSRPLSRRRRSSPQDGAALRGAGTPPAGRATTGSRSPARDR